MLPDQLIYDELEKMRRERSEEQESARPQLEMPRYQPYWTESEAEAENADAEETDRGVIIMKM